MTVASKSARPVGRPPDARTSRNPGFCTTADKQDQFLAIEQRHIGLRRGLLRKLSHDINRRLCV